MLSTSYECKILTNWPLINCKIKREQGLNHDNNILFFNLNLMFIKYTYFINTNLFIIHVISFLKFSHF